MKKLILTASFILFAGNANAISFGDVLKDVGNDSQKSLNKSLDNKIDKVVKKFEDKVDGKIKQYEDKIAKYEDRIKEVEQTFDRIKRLKDNAEFYIGKAKLILGILSSGILALIFVMWRIWRNIVTMKNVVKNVASYDDIEKRLKAVEKKVL